MTNFMSSPHYDYSSTQIMVPYLLSNEILRWGDDHISDELLYADPENPIFGREDEPHVTAIYGLHTDHPEEVQRIVEDVDAFEIRLGKVSIFTMCSKFDVIKIEVDSPALHKLNFMLRQLPNTQYYSTFRPHITIAYLKKGAGQELVGDTTFLNRYWVPKSVVFSSRNNTRTIIPLKFKLLQRKVS